MDLILGYAAQQDDIRVVFLNGSRVNPNVKKDHLRDYDVIYFARDVLPFRRSPALVRFFGEPLIVQLPDDMGSPPPADDGTYQYLMQFMDGTRIDLGIEPLSHIAACLEDSLTVVLLDKDGLVGNIAPPSDRSYLPEEPKRKEFDDCCNEFWWLNPYVAKGLLRDQLPYVKHVLEGEMRAELMKMVTWHIGVQNGFSVSTGMFGKYLKSHLEPELWRSLERTYSSHRFEDIWASLFEMGGLFRTTGRSVAKSFAFTYPEEDDMRVSAFVRKMKARPTL
jgi:aminoglycoside 6-adenylyltransferase